MTNTNKENTTGRAEVDAEIKQIEQEEQDQKQDNTKPKYGEIELQGNVFGVHRKPTNMQLMAMASYQRRNKEQDYMGVLYEIIGRCLHTDFPSFEDYYNSLDYDELAIDEEELLVRVFEGVIEASMNEAPKAS